MGGSKGSQDKSWDVLRSREITDRRYGFREIGYLRRRDARLDLAGVGGLSLLPERFLET